MGRRDFMSREALVALALYVLLAGCTLLPGFNWIAIWLLPMPLIALAVLEANWVPAALSACVGLFLVLTGFGWCGVVFGLGMYALARVVGEQLANDTAVYPALAFATLIFIMMELTLLALIRALGVDIRSWTSQLIQSWLLADARVLHLTQADIRRLADENTRWTLLLLPAIIIVSSFVVAAVNVEGARGLLRRRLAAIRPVIDSWNLPYATVVLYVLSQCIILTGWLHTASFWWQAVQNTAFVAGFFIGIQGLAWLWRRFSAVHRRRYIWLLALIALPLTVRYAGTVYVFIGMLDLMNQHRRFLR